MVCSQRQMRSPLASYYVSGDDHALTLVNPTASQCEESRVVTALAEGSYLLGLAAAYPIDHPRAAARGTRQLVRFIMGVMIIICGFAGLWDFFHPGYVPPSATGGVDSLAISRLGASPASAASSPAPPGTAARPASAASAPVIKVGVSNGAAAPAPGSRPAVGVTHSDPTGLAAKVVKAGAPSGAGASVGRAAAAAGRAVRSGASPAGITGQSSFCSAAAKSWLAHNIRDAMSSYALPMAADVDVQTMVELGCLYSVDPSLTAGLFLHEDGNINNSSLFPGHVNRLLSHTHNPGNIKCMYDPCYDGFQVYPLYKDGIVDWFRLYDHYYYDLGIHDLAAFVRTYCPGGVDGNGPPDQYTGDVQTKQTCIRGGWGTSSCAANL